MAPKNSEKSKQFCIACVNDHNGFIALTEGKEKAKKPLQKKSVYCDKYLPCGASGKEEGTLCCVKCPSLLTGCSDIWIKQNIKTCHRFLAEDL